MDLEIKNFGIKNFRSFDHDGVFIDNINQINVFIGKNNAGKSNVLKFIKTLSDNLIDLVEFPNDLINNHKRNVLDTILYFSFNFSDLKIPSIIRVNHGNVKLTDYIPSEFEIEYRLGRELEMKLPEEMYKMPMEALMYFVQKKPSQYTKDKLISLIKGQFEVLIRENLKTFKSVVYIPHFRIIQEGIVIKDSNSELNGSNIISEIFAMQIPKLGEESKRERFNKIQDLVKDLLNVRDLILEVPASQDELIVKMHGNRLSLESFGTGIQQLVILCSTLIIYSDKIVCIEEPEIHLHPELQRKFLNFLKTTNNVYFITTHSNIFIEEQEKLSVYHVGYDGEKSTINRASTSEHSSRLLDDLGYKNSDLLHSNCIIWVEGPSDRVYLKKWLALLNIGFKEGLHYSIMFYGGSILSNLSCKATFDIEEELIPLLRLNRNAYVIIDSDILPDKKKNISSTKERIKHEIGESKCWITKDKEIENYLNKKVLSNWLSSKGIKVMEGFSAPEGKIIDDVLKEPYVSKSIVYSLKKNIYAREIIRFIEVEDLEYSDLQKKIQEISSWIKTCNHLN